MTGVHITPIPTEPSSPLQKAHAAPLLKQSPLGGRGFYSLNSRIKKKYFLTGFLSSVFNILQCTVKGCNQSKEKSWNKNIILNRQQNLTFAY